MHRITFNDIVVRFASPDAAPRSSISIPQYTRAAVLVPLIHTNNSFDLLFTKRTDSVETHKGQISFPGGMADASDKDSVDTALREAREEIGLPQSSVRILGLLDDLATPTGFVITPVVGLVPELPALSLNSKEVDEVFRVGLEFFAQAANGRTEMREFHGRKHEVWYYHWNERVISGATAFMIRSLLKKLDMI